MRSPMMKMSLIFVAALSVLAGCGTTLSDRELQREKAKAAAAIKRAELMLVAGDYVGSLSMGDGAQSATLHLEIKDIPQVLEGQVDPVLVPRLSGYLRFVFGDPTNSTEFIGFALSNGDYDPKRNKVDLVVESTESKQIVLALDLKGEALEGTYVAPGLSASGSVNFRKGTASATTSIQGEYRGFVARQREKLFQRAELSVATSVQPPEGLKVSASLRLYPGEADSVEFTTYRFDQVGFNPVSGQLILRSSTSDVVVTGVWSTGKIGGNWSTTSTGTMGLVSLARQGEPVPPADLVPYARVRGTYRGKLVNASTESNLPERVEVTVNVRQDASAANGLRFSGGIRLFLGGFDSLEFVEAPFDDIQYQFFTRQFSATTSGKPRLVLKGTLDEQGLVVAVSADGVADAATIRAVRRNER